jgi:hypothetical protein
MVDGWTKIPILVCVDQIVDELGFKNLIKVILNSMMKGQGLSREELCKKFLCYGDDGIISRNQPKCNQSIYDYMRLVVICD